MDQAERITSSVPPPGQKIGVIRRFAAFLGVLFAAFIGYEIHSFIDLVNPHDYRSWTHGNAAKARVTSPDGRLDAVVYCYCDTPAMVSPYFYLHIIPTGHIEEEASSPAVMVSRRGLNLTWTDNAHLRVYPGRGAVEFFTNLWAPHDDNLPFVEITLASDVANRLITPDGHFAN